MSGREIREKIEAIAGGTNNSIIFTAEVVKVNGDSCSIQYGEMELSGVKLFSIGAAGNFLIKPAIGTMVTVADLSGGNKRDMVIIKIDKVEQLKFEHNKLVFDLDGKASKIEISSKQVSLLSLFDELINIIKNLKVNVLAPNSPSATVTPDVLLLLEKFESSIKQLLK